MELSYRWRKPVNITTVLRQSGYHPIINRRTSTTSWVRPLSKNFYPRFHLYVTTNQTNISLSLHLDQKQSTLRLAKTKRHAGEYHSPVVQAEAARLQRWLEYSQGA